MHMDVNVLGASGYAGGQLLRILAKHPHFKLKHAFANSKAGVKISDEHPFLEGIFDQNFAVYEESKLKEKDVLLIALPHGESGEIAKNHPKNQIVDLGADFRLKSESNWKKYYEGSFSGTWIYGLPEIEDQRSLISKNIRIANPGCYATAIILSLAPFLKAKIVDLNYLSIVATSGTTGAGKKTSQNLLASEVMGSISNYKMGGKHQHIAEIQETLSEIYSENVKISFNPTLGPFTRGILANSIFKLNKKFSLDDLNDIFQKYYMEEEFIHLVLERNVSTSEVINTNNAKFNIFLDIETGQVTVACVLDNLIKGAAGQAIQNLNLMNGLEENLGLI